MTYSEEQGRTLTEWADSMAERCQTGPNYLRAVADNVTDARREIGRGNYDTAAYWLRQAADAELFATTGERRLPGAPPVEAGEAR